MNKLILLGTLLMSTCSGIACPDLNGTWEGICDRDGKTAPESITIEQEKCEAISFYGLTYKIGMPYEERGENLYEKMTNIYNFYWGEDEQVLYFDVDRIRWMKYKNVVSTGEGKGVIKIDGDKMRYFRSYYSRDREGQYNKSVRSCSFERVKTQKTGS